MPVVSMLNPSNSLWFRVSNSCSYLNIEILKCQKSNFQDLMIVFITYYNDGDDDEQEQEQEQEASLIELQVLLGKGLALRIDHLCKPGQQRIVKVQPPLMSKVYFDRGENCTFVLGNLLSIAR